MKGEGGREGKKNLLPRCLVVGACGNGGTRESRAGVRGCGWCESNDKHEPWERVGNPSAYRIHPSPVAAEGGGEKKSEIESSAMVAAYTVCGLCLSW